MNNQHVNSQLQDFIDGCLKEHDRVDVINHLIACESCRTEYETLQQLVEDIHKLPRSITPSHRLLEVIEAQLHSKPKLPDVGGLVEKRNGAVDRKPVPQLHTFRKKSVESPLLMRVAAMMILSAALYAVWLTIGQKEQQPLLSSRTDVTTQTGEQATKTTEGTTETAEKKNSSLQTPGSQQLTQTLHTPPASSFKINLPGPSSPAHNAEKEKPVNTSIADLNDVKKSESSPVQPPASSQQNITSSETIQMPDVKNPGDIVSLQSGIVTYDLVPQDIKTREIKSIIEEIASFIPSTQRALYYVPTQDEVIAEDAFHDALLNPVSTFSVDVDNSSYSNIGKFISTRKLPPKDAVRIEEMINYFRYDYPQPKGDNPFSLVTELSACPWNQENKLLLIGLQGKKINPRDLPPSNLVFLVDVSGSMDSPNKLPLVKGALSMLVNELREQDKVSIISYGASAKLVLPATRGDRKQKILDAISQLETSGSISGDDGMVFAYNIASEAFVKGGNNRIVFATDGDFTMSDSDSRNVVSVLGQLQQKGVFLSILGFGEGNGNNKRLEFFADKGNGNYTYIENVQTAQRVLVKQFTGTFYTIAKDVKIQVEFNPMKVKSYRLIGYENHILGKRDFSDDRTEAGEIGEGHSATALYEIIPSSGPVSIRVTDSLRYQSTASKEISSELLAINLRYKRPEASISTLLTKPVRDESIDLDEASLNFRFASAVAQFGMLLRGYRFNGNASFDDVIALARTSLGHDFEGSRAEFVNLVESYKRLAQ